jgi:DNA-binding transcriptional ArsR family regulator
MVNDYESRLNAVFHALSSPTRRGILRQLAAREITVGELAEPYEMSVAAISKHLDVLEGAGLIERTKEGRVTRCRFHPEPLIDASRILDDYRSFWSRRLDSLEAYFDGRGGKGAKRR